MPNMLEMKSFFVFGNYAICPTAVSNQNRQPRKIYGGEKVEN